MPPRSLSEDDVKSRRLSQWMMRLGADPETATSRWEYLVRYVVELARHCVRQLRHDRAGQMASALAFRTIFGLVPLSVIGLLAFRLTGGVDRFESFLREVLNAADLGSLEMPVKAADGTTGQTIHVVDWVVNLIQDINAQVNFESIGLVGLAIFIWAAISLMTTIERSFNFVCRAEEHRSLSRRVPLYFFVIVMGPALVYLSFYLDHRFAAMVASLAEHVGPLGSWLVRGVGVFTSLGSSWLFFLVLYLYVPNTRLRLTATASGALVSALLMALGAKALGGYMSSVFAGGSHYAILYGTLGLIPVFLFWVYLMWLVILFGLEISVTVQAVGMSLKSVRSKRPDLPPMLDPTCVIPIMAQVSDLFNDGKTADVATVAGAAGVNEAAVEFLLRKLADRGLLNRIQGDETEQRVHFAPARPADRIALDDLVSVAQDVCGQPDRQSPAWSLVHDLRESQRRAMAGQSLATIRRATPPPESSEPTAGR